MPESLHKARDTAAIIRLVELRIGSGGPKLYRRPGCGHLQVRAGSTARREDKQYHHGNEYFLHICLLGCITRRVDCPLRGVDMKRLPNHRRDWGDVLVRSEWV